MPRAGVAWRIDEKTSFRFGYARHILPTEFKFIDAPFAGFENINFLEPPYLGIDASQNPAPVLQGVPQARLSDPFPASNPIIGPKGKGYARYLEAGGYNFLFGYVYHLEKKQEFYDEVAQFLNSFTYQESNIPRHRISAAGTWELPFGKGRKFMPDANPVVDGILGGWQLVGAWYFNSGDFLRFGAMLAEGDPTIPDRSPKRWFDTSKLKQLPPYTQRINPKQYPRLTGPKFWDVQGTISKNFRITERVKTEFKVAAYSVPNRLNRSNPDTGVLSSTFGQTLRQRTTVGRQLEFGLKIHF